MDGSTSVVSSSGLLSSFSFSSVLNCSLSSARSSCSRPSCFPWFLFRPASSLLFLWTLLSFPPPSSRPPLVWFPFPHCLVCSSLFSRGLSGCSFLPSVQSNYARPLSSSWPSSPPPFSSLFPSPPPSILPATSVAFALFFSFLCSSSFLRKVGDAA